MRKIAQTVTGIVKMWTVKLWPRFLPPRMRLRSSTGCGLLNLTFHRLTSTHLLVVSNDTVTSRGVLSKQRNLSSRNQRHTIASALYNFLMPKILPAGFRVRRPPVCHRGKFCCNRLNHCGKMAIFKMLK